MRSTLSVTDLYRRAMEVGVPLVGGHRGNPAEHPENTLASFRSAIELGVEMIECDVHLSADGQLVVIHDHTLDRTTNGSGLVKERTLAELRDLDAGSGEGLPLLAEVCEVARGRACVCIEVKQFPVTYPGLEEKLLAELRELDFVGQTAIISFQQDSVRRLKNLEPGLVVGVVEAAIAPEPGVVLRSASAEIYAAHYGAMDRRLVEEVGRDGGVVGVWTVDNEAALAWCRVCRPLSIFTNRPREIGAAITSGAFARPKGD
jgi:glycerophosphoryl diester phosphodiesterase